MSWRLGKQYAKVWEVEDKGTYAIVKLGTSRSNKEKTETFYSNWSFIRFVGDAYEGICDVEKGQSIYIKRGDVKLEKYKDKDGNDAWPKNPQFTVYSWCFPDDVGEDDDEKPKKKAASKKPAAKKKPDYPEVADEEEFEDIPF